MINLSPLSTELFLSVGCECLPDSRARTGEKRAGGAGGLGKKGILVNVETQFNFRSQAVLSGNKQHLRMPAVFLYCWLCEDTQNEARTSKLSRKSLRVFTSVVICCKSLVVKVL